MNTPNVQAALVALNEFYAREVGIKPRRKRKAKVLPAPSPKLKVLNAYRKEHPEASLREAAIAAGYNIK